MHDEALETPDGRLHYDETQDAWVLADKEGRTRRLSGAAAVALLSALVAQPAFALTFGGGGSYAPLD